jgi:hypothetical protein
LREMFWHTTPSSLFRILQKLSLFTTFFDSFIFGKPSISIFTPNHTTIESLNH